MAIPHIYRSEDRKSLGESARMLSLDVRSPTRPYGAKGSLSRRMELTLFSGSLWFLETATPPKSEEVMSERDGLFAVYRNFKQEESRITPAHLLAGLLIPILSLDTGLTVIYLVTIGRYCAACTSSILNGPAPSVLVQSPPGRRTTLNQEIIS